MEGAEAFFLVIDRKNDVDRFHNYRTRSIQSMVPRSPSRSVTQGVQCNFTLALEMSATTSRTSAVRVCARERTGLGLPVRDVIASMRSSMLTECPLPALYT